MSVEIKTATIEPVRQNFGRVTRRFGDKPVTRYQEASFDLQPMANFHYRPVWDPQREVYDARRTQVVMADWDAFKDPRQFYYATYVIQRARTQEIVERHFEFVEKNALVGSMDASLLDAARALLPLRHLEWAANANNCMITAYGFGSAITQGAMYATTDRLAIAQYLSRIGLLIDGNTGLALQEAKRAWMEDADWQPMRRLAEDLMATPDWFELLVAQDLVLDGLLYPLVYGRFDGRATVAGAATLPMLTTFMTEWSGEFARWVDACVKLAAAESAGNRTLLSSWAAQWSVRATEALAPVARRLYGSLADAALEGAVAGWRSRIAALGLAIDEGSRA